MYVELPRAGVAPVCEFTVLDLNDGGATHLRADGRDWLLDCGHTSRYSRTILPYLRSRGVNRLDGLLLSHGDADHIGSSVEVLGDFSPRIVIDSPLKDRSGARRALLAEMQARQLGKRIARSGDAFPIAPEAKLRVLFPPPGLVRSQADDKALVVRLECAGRRVLFMSDSGFATEQWLLQNQPDLRADVVVKGQHAKDFSGTAEFLARVQPAAIICSGLGFGAQPDALDAWTQRVSAQGITLFRQDECGAVVAEIRDGEITLRGFANGQIFKSRAR